jgi:SAM-dependent methyltransferase
VRDEVNISDPSQFYTGVVAALYGPLRSTGAPDPSPYARFIERSGQPALELGCGFGEPLLDLVAEGFDVDGLDSSPDMIEQCRANAQARGLDVGLHLQPIQAMAIDRSYRSIFLAGPTFNLLPDDETALQALIRIRDHLAPDGSVLVPLFIPKPTPEPALGRPRVHVTDEGVEMRFTAVSEHRDDATRVQTTLARYERRDGSTTELEERDWLLHWYRVADICALVERAGLVVARMLNPAGGPVDDDSDEFVLILRHAPVSAP